MTARFENRNDRLSESPTANGAVPVTVSLWASRGVGGGDRQLTDTELEVSLTISAEASLIGRLEDGPAAPVRQLMRMQQLQPAVGHASASTAYQASRTQWLMLCD